MRVLEKSLIKRYSIFISTIILITVMVLVIVQNRVNNLKNDAFLINKSGKQRVLSQSISKMAFAVAYNLDETLKLDALNSLKKSIDELENAHHYLNNIKKGKDQSDTIDSLLRISESDLKKILTSSKNIINNPDSESIISDVKIIAGAESSFLLTMDAVVNEYQNASEKKLDELLKAIYFLVLISGIILIAELIFVLLPALRNLLQQNDKLTKANNELAESQNKIKSNLEELNKLKTDLESKERYNKVFIEQAPTAIAMLDKNMHYIAVSQRWIKDYKLEGQEIIGRSHYDVFPEIGEVWKEKHQESLNGAIDVCDEAPFVRTDGTVQWIYWDIRPWYISENEIGGLLMHTGDITQAKEKDDEKIRIEKILDKTNEVARVGTWEVDLLKGEVFWSKVVREIHEVPENYEPDLDTGINFYKEGSSRDTINKVIEECTKNGTSFDIEVELVTANNNIIWVRTMGQAEMIDGRCVSILGVFQDINEMKIAQIELNNAHTQLEAIFNSGHIAIVTTDIDGVINRFNRGAEALTGYSASEVIGLQKPFIYHTQDELDQFTNDIAKLYGKNPEGFHPQKELSKNNAHDTREWTYVRKDGYTLPVQLTLSGIKDEAGEDIGFLGVSFDITERKKAENELVRKNQLLSFAEKITMMGNWQWDTITNDVIWSANLYNIFGNEANSAITYDTYFSFVHPEDKEKVTAHVLKSIEDKKFIDLIHRIQLTDGTVKTIQLLAEIIVDKMDNVIELIGTCQDITERRMAENKFRGLLESAPDAMVIVNEEGKIQLANKQAEKLFGYPTEELFGKSVEILIPNRFAGTHSAHRDVFFASPKTRGMGQGKELYGVNKDGVEIPIQISLSPLKTEEGLLVSAAIRDITNQKLAENKIIESKEKLEILADKLTRQNTQLADFAHITSHNLRAPVSNLNSLLELYNESEKEEDKTELFKRFEKVIHHLTLTLNTLVEALKTKTVNSQDNEDIYFDKVLEMTKEILYGQIVKSGAIITSDFSKIKKVSFNKIYLESIFLNLLSNSIKYRSKARIPEIFIESDIKDGKITLKFKDNGMGIDLKRHGNKLFGLNKVFHRHPEAQGVGLFITKAQIDAMGGVISVSSTVNEGTVFSIKFN